MPEKDKFTQDELMALFQTMVQGGTGAPPGVAAGAPSAAPAAPAAPAKPAAVPPPAPPKAEAPPPPPPSPAPPPTPPPAPVDSSAPRPKSPEEIKVEELVTLFEFVRARMEQVLTPFIGDKVTKKMLAWSFERVSKNHPILKDTHWSMSGEYLDNGGIEPGRVLKNVESLRGQDVVALAKSALLDLLKMRLSAVEQGLPSLRQAVEKEVGKLGDMLK